MSKHIIALLLMCSTHASAATPAEGDSTTLITNKSGEVVQRVEYLPTGETFIEQQDTSWVSPYKFNGKELDEETGLYYSGWHYWI